MIDGCGQASFPPEPVACQRMIGGVLSNGLQRDLPTETRIDCLVDATHPTLTEQL